MPSARYILEDQQMMSRARNYFAWQARLVLPHLGRRVVEVGCGLGNFTGWLLDRDMMIAADCDAGLLARLRARYPGRANLHTVECDAADACFRELARFAPDSCVALNVIEHIGDDAAALANMASILPPGGVVVLLAPAMAALSGPIDRNLGHFRRYSKRSMVALAEVAGLRVECLRYVNALGAVGWWLNAKVMRREAQSRVQIAVFDRVVAPVMSRLEALVPAPFGQSLLAVLRK